jgi:hypothetical protein
VSTQLSSDHRVSIPENFVQQDDLHVGQWAEVARLREGLYLVEMTSGSPSRERLMDVLLACPVKDWWKPETSPELLSLQPSALFAE